MDQSPDCWSLWGTLMGRYFCCFCLRGKNRFSIAVIIAILIEAEIIWCCFRLLSPLSITTLSWICVAFQSSCCLEVCDCMSFWACPDSTHLSLLMETAGASYPPCILPSSCTYGALRFFFRMTVVLRDLLDLSVLRLVLKKLRVNLLYDRHWVKESRLPRAWGWASHLSEGRT